MEFIFSISISYDAFLAYYKGIADKVAITDIHGRNLYVNAKYFRPFLTINGIQGRFKLVLDSNGKYQSLNKL
ncbi:DUF2835 domain-containing protein [Shewanella aestuarii]|uniref:DUF2835 domain-containing protein n=1 Tax=Shewanella aestuarii TaxID=1028752 RepID=A0A6G9QIV7_9GAMM|nr:DUF2835 domain-containing protein [Shewanella aestuarii]QIR14436.1 DUF2835 domain-containing protein [Shewanella aestuarii]